jgi:hypothetical protein
LSNNEPIFKSIFGASWDALPPVMHKHYANRPYCNDCVQVEGCLEVMCKGPIRILAPLFRSLGQIPARNETNVPVTVLFRSNQTTADFQFDRVFKFKGTEPYHFRSRMRQLKGNEVVEIMRFRLAWKMLYLWDGEKVVLQHKGYALSLFGWLIPLPLTYLLGSGHAEETAVDENTFDMITHISHPWWGKIYEYKGRFEIT